MIDITHKACGELAFRLSPNALQLGVPIKAGDITNLDGTHPKPDTMPVCGSCGESVNFGSEELTLG